MAWFAKFINSTAGKIINFFIGFLGLILTILLVLFPELFVKKVTLGGLFLISVYICVLLMRVVILKAISQVTEKLTNDITVNLREYLQSIQHNELKIMSDAEINYNYQANRYGVGYKYFLVKCIIYEDGAASIVREVEVEAYSEISELDTFMQIPEEDSQGKLRTIEKEGRIQTADSNRNLELVAVKNKPGSMYAKIKIEPPLKNGETLRYIVYDFSLAKGLFGIDLTKAEISGRSDPNNDYFGWHISRPTREFQIQVSFPTGREPNEVDRFVKFASAAGFPSEQLHTEETKNLKVPKLTKGLNNLLTLDVNYPLSGLVYIVKWKPILKK